MPSISLVGNIRPVSTTTISPSYSTTVMFLPISPRPPSGRMRTAVTRRSPADSYWALAGAARNQQSVMLERRPDRRSLVVARRDHRQPHVRVDDPEELEGCLHRDRIRGDHGGVVDRDQALVNLARSGAIARRGRVVKGPHLG